jgi:hypothetical protein
MLGLIEPKTFIEFVLIVWAATTYYISSTRWVICFRMYNKTDVLGTVRNNVKGYWLFPSTSRVIRNFRWKHSGINNTRESWLADEMTPPRDLIFRLYNSPCHSVGQMDTVLINLDSDRATILQCCGSGTEVFLTPGSGIRDGLKKSGFGSGMDNPDHISESLEA